MPLSSARYRQSLLASYRHYPRPRFHISDCAEAVPEAMNIRPRHASTEWVASLVLSPTSSNRVTPERGSISTHKSPRRPRCPRFLPAILPLDQRRWEYSADSVPAVVVTSCN